MPLMLSILAAVNEMWWLYPVAAALQFVVVGVLPAARRQESVFMYTLTAVSAIPLNLMLVQMAWSMLLLSEYSLIYRLLLVISAYCVLLNLEEIVFGMLIRNIWKKQRGNIFCQRNQ